MPLASGTRLGPYEILEPLGAGGMGEVYRARDTRLDRMVAIKILPPEVSSDPERRSRFEREAKSIAALSHPHICAIHDVGRDGNVDFLVMELLTGTPLDAKLKSGPLAMTDALVSAKQIAEALSAAHGRGIVHRDLKPANVMLTPSGAKLLDFGLATAVTEPADAAGRTRTAALTEHGAVIGTPQYMAPEQLEGKPVDARTDVFALGALIFEMATGHRAFNRTTTEMPGAPAALQRLVAVCLSRNPDDRWSSARDVLLQLKGISEAESGDAVRATRVRGHSSQRWGWIAAAIAVAGLISVLMYGRLGLDPAAPTRDLLSIIPPDGTALDEGTAPEISPDGQHVAFVASDRSGTSAIYVRSRKTNAASVLPNTEGGTMPFWAPDSQRLAFFAQGQLKTIELGGGSPHAIASAPIARGGSWGADDRILFVPRVASGPYIVPAAGGEVTAAPMPEPVIEPRQNPAILPDGRHYLFLAIKSGQGSYAVHVGSLDSPESKELVRSTAGARYVRPGYLVFRRDSSLLAQALDPRTLELSGSPLEIAGDVGIQPITYQGLFSVSDTGVVVYQTSAPNTQLVWFDRQGKRLGTLGAPANYNALCFSADGKRVIHDVADPISGAVDIAMTEIGGSTTRLTFAPLPDFYPVCARAGQEIVFSSIREGRANLYRQTTTSPGSESPILRTNLPKLPSDISRTGQVIYTELRPKTNWDLLVLDESGKESRTYLATEADERTARLSPDERWIAYVSNESGTYEVYVQPFPTPTGAKWQVSKGGGGLPQWRADGSELYYVTPDKNLMTVAVRTTGGTFSLGTTSVLMTTRIAGWDLTSGTLYAPWPDGQRFLINTANDGVRSISVVLNWNAAPGR